MRCAEPFECETRDNGTGHPLFHHRNAGGAAADAYAVLGASPDASATEVKKRFWRVSLLIHPDKCSHAQAGAAFDAVKKAAQALQDSGARAELDAQRHAAADAELDRAVMAELERERQWRVLQGKGTAEDLKCAPCHRCSVFGLSLAGRSQYSAVNIWTAGVLTARAVQGRNQAG